MRPDDRPAILENQRITLSVEPMDQYSQKMDLPVTWSLLTENGQLYSLEGEEVQFIAVFTEDLDQVLTDFQGRWQKAGLQEATLVTPILKEHTFEPSSQRVESMNMVVHFVGTPLPPLLVELSIVP